MRRRLLRSLLGRTRPVADDIPRHDRVGVVHTVMPGPTARHHPIVRRGTEAFLGNLLETALVVLIRPVGEVPHVLEEDPNRNAKALVEEDSSDHRLE